MKHNVPALGTWAISLVVGFGLDTNGGVDECLTADTLACNNFYADVFGPDNSILPDIADGYFRSLSGTDDTQAQGRYLWISGVAVSETPVLALFVAGLIALRLT